jgi:hypothetical protein
VGQVRKILIELAEDATDDQVANIAVNIKEEYPETVAGIEISLWEDLA